MYTLTHLSILGTCICAHKSMREAVAPYRRAWISRGIHMHTYLGIFKAIHCCCNPTETQLGHCLKLETGEPHSLHFLLQRISVALQRDNAAAVLGIIN